MGWNATRTLFSSDEPNVPFAATLKGVPVTVLSCESGTLDPGDRWNNTMVIEHEDGTKAKCRLGALLWA